MREQNPRPDRAGGGGTPPNLKTRTNCHLPGGATLPQWAVRGSYQARRKYWQGFTKVREAPTAEAAREQVLSEIGGSHHVPRTMIRIESVAAKEGSP